MWRGGFTSNQTHCVRERSGFTSIRWIQGILFCLQCERKTSASASGERSITIWSIHNWINTVEEAGIGSCSPPPQFNSRTVLKGTTRNFQLLLVLAPPLDKSGTTPEPAVVLPQDGPMRSCFYMWSDHWISARVNDNYIKPAVCSRFESSEESQKMRQYLI